MRAIRYNKPNQAAIDDLMPMDQCYGNAAFALRDLAIMLCDAAEEQKTNSDAVIPDWISKPTPETCAQRYENGKVRIHSKNDLIDPDDALYPIADLVKYLSLCNVMVDNFRIGASTNSIATLNAYIMSGHAINVNVPIVGLLRLYLKFHADILKKYSIDELPLAEDELIYTLIASFYSCIDPMFDSCFNVHYYHDIATSDYAVFNIAGFLHSRAFQAERKEITLDTIWIDSIINDICLHSLWSTFIDSYDEISKLLSSHGYMIKQMFPRLYGDTSSVIQSWMGMIATRDDERKTANAFMRNLRINSDVSYLIIDSMFLQDEPSVPNIKHFMSALIMQMNFNPDERHMILNAWNAFYGFTKRIMSDADMARRSNTCTLPCNGKIIATDCEFTALLTETAVNMLSQSTDSIAYVNIIPSILLLSYLSEYLSNKDVDEATAILGVDDLMRWAGQTTSENIATDTTAYHRVPIIGRRQEAMIRQWIEKHPETDSIDYETARKILTENAAERFKPADLRSYYSRNDFILDKDLDYSMTFDAMALMLADYMSGGAIRNVDDDTARMAVLALRNEISGEVPWPGALSLSKDQKEAPYTLVAHASSDWYDGILDEDSDTEAKQYRDVIEMRKAAETRAREGNTIVDRLEDDMNIMIAAEKALGIKYRHTKYNTANFPYGPDGKTVSDEEFGEKPSENDESSTSANAVRIDPDTGAAVYDDKELKKFSNASNIETDNIGRNQSGRIPSRANESSKNNFAAIGTDTWRPSSIMKMRTLIAFSNDLTADAAFNGVGENVLCRDEIIDEMVTILTRREKSNPVLLAAAGTGKTAIVEGLAKRIVDGDIPILRNKRILSFDIMGVIAKSPSMPSAAETVKKAMNEAIEAGVIVFIDEIHVLGGDAHKDSTIANALKPLLSRPGLSIIGATTEKEYNVSLAQDKALQRRFSALRVPVLGFEDIVRVVEGKRDEYGVYHHVRYPSSLSREIVLLASSYLGSRPSPDRELDVVDVSGSLAQRRGADAVSESDIVNAVKMLSSNKDVKTQQEMAENALTDDKALIEMFPSIAGQNDAKITVGKTLLASQLGVTSGDRPRSVMLFAGSSGVGKSELAKAVARACDLDATNDVLSLSMSEYVTEADYTKLIGTGPQWIGYKDGGVLTNFISSHPSGIIVLDEFDMCNAKVTNLFMGMFDSGKVRNGIGEELDCRRNIFICTTNVGYRDKRKTISLGFVDMNKQDANADKSKVKEALKEKFGAAMMSRFDAIILFDDLSDEDKVAACRIHRDDYAKTIMGRFNLSLDETVPWTDTQKRIEEIISELGDEANVRTIWSIVEKELAHDVLNAISAASRKQTDIEKAAIEAAVIASSETETAPEPC